MAEINRRSDSKNYQANFNPAEKDWTTFSFNRPLTERSLRLQKPQMKPASEVSRLFNVGQCRASFEI
jgi:hypothetical protein